MNFLRVILLWLPIVVTAKKGNETKIIVDVLQSFHKPSNVIANLCWKTSSKKQLMSDLTVAVNPMSIKYVDAIDMKDLLIKEKNIFLIDLSCPGLTEFLKLANSSKLFSKPYRWFIISVLGSEGLPSDIDNLHILADSEVYITRCNESDSCRVDLVYKIRPHLHWILENYGLWTAEAGLLKYRHVKEMTAPMRRKNVALETITTSVVITDESTLDNLDDLRYPLIDSVSKSMTQQLMPLYHFMNATRRLIYAKTWGYLINGSWTGMLGDMVEGRAELAGTLLFMTEQRLEIQEYLTFPSSIPIKFIFHEPPLSYQNNLYLLPFKASVWYCCGSFVVIMILVLLVNAQWEAKKLKVKNSLQKELASTMLYPSVSEVTVFVISAMTQQGSTVELKGTLGRVVIFILFLVFLFLYTAYSASIVVLLQSSSNQIRTLSDLLQSKLELGVEDTPYNRFWFSVAKEPIRKAIYEKKIAPKGAVPKFYSVVEGIKMMQNRPFAFHTNLGVGYQIIEQYFQEHEKCGLQEIAFIQDSSPWSSCYKLSPYKEIFKIGLLRIQEHGLTTRVNHLIFAKRPVCSVRGGRFVSVSIVDCYPSLLVLLYGLLIAILLLIIEILYDKRCKINKRGSANTVLLTREIVPLSLP